MKTAELFDVRGLVTIVTGAASGIGLAYAEVMADNGARVTLMDRDASSLEAAVRRLAERGGDVRGQTLDVTDRPGLRAGIDAVAAHYGRLDVVFANVGIDSPPGFLGMNGERNAGGAFENVSDERWDLVMLDLSLPDRRGAATLRDIRAISPALPVVVMSLHPEAEYRAVLRAAGATDYVSKASAAPSIAAVVRAALGLG